MSSLFDKLFKKSSKEKQRFGMLYQSFLKSKRRSRFQTEKTYRIKSNIPLIDKSKFLYDIPDSMIFPNSVSSIDETEENADEFLKEFGELLDPDYYLPENVLNLLGLGHLVENHSEHSEKSSESVTVSKNNDLIKNTSTVTTKPNICAAANVNITKSDTGNQQIMEEINSLKRKYNTQHETSRTLSPMRKNLKKNLNTPSNSISTSFTSKPQTPNGSRLKTSGVPTESDRECNIENSTNVEDTNMSKSDSKTTDKLSQEGQVVNKNDVCNSPRFPGMTQVPNFSRGPRMNYAANFPRGHGMNFNRGPRVNFNRGPRSSGQRINNVSHFLRGPSREVSNVNSPKCSSIKSMSDKSSHEPGTEPNSNTSSTSNELEIVFCDTPTKIPNHSKKDVQKRLKNVKAVKKRTSNSLPTQASDNFPRDEDQSLQSQKTDEPGAKCSPSASAIELDSELTNTQPSTIQNKQLLACKRPNKKKKKKKNPQSNNEFMRDIHAMLSQLLNFDRHAYNSTPTVVPMIVTKDFYKRNPQREICLSNPSCSTITGKEMSDQFPILADSNLNIFDSSFIPDVINRVETLETEVDLKPEIIQTSLESDAITLSNKTDATVSDSPRRPRIFLKDPALLYEVPEAHCAKENNDRSIDNAIATVEKSPMSENRNSEATQECSNIPSATEHSNNIVQATPSSQPEENRIDEYETSEQSEKQPDDTDIFNDLPVEIADVDNRVHALVRNDCTGLSNDNSEVRVDHTKDGSNHLKIKSNHQIELRNNEADTRNNSETGQDSDIEKEALEMSDIERTKNENVDKLAESDILNETLKINKELQKSLIRQEAQLANLTKCKKSCDKCAEVTDILFLTGISAEQKICILQSLHSLSQQ